ncbi:MAG: transglycosylase domain-containing protein, partial [Bradymonadaceae bacterium]
MSAGELSERESAGSNEALEPVEEFPNPRRRRSLLRLMLSIIFAPVYTPARTIVTSLFLLTAFFITQFIFEEIRSSRLQSQYLSAFAQDIYYWTEEGPNRDAQFPVTGPYNSRLGYSHVAVATERLERRGYEVTSQARMSQRMSALTERGFFPIYKEKSRAGLTVLDRDGDAIYEAALPERKFDSFEDLPDLLVETLLFIENRELLDPRYPNRNPAVEWKRFTLAAVALTGRMLGIETDVFGGSTLATQIEKFRHSEDGRTRTSQDKIQQMVTASLRSYLDGEDTWESQRRIILEYVNGVPLAATRGYGEVHGMADGLWAWYGEDPHELMTHLQERPGLWSAKPNPAYGEQLMNQARAYRMILSLLIAHRRPSYYLVQNTADLQDMTDQYLRVLANSQRISEGLRDRALATRIEVKRGVPQPPAPSFVERKAVDSIRTHLLHHVGIPGLYDLDRFDLKVHTTIDSPSQQGVTDVLKRLDEPAFVAGLGLKGHRLLEKNADLSPLVYSFTLYERTDLGNVLRIQADSYDQPMNINEQTKLDLGSTAKLRTLVTYLEVAAELHGRFHTLSDDALREARTNARDNLTRWAADYLLRANDRSLETMLRAAMARPYSG